MYLTFFKYFFLNGFFLDAENEVQPKFIDFFNKWNPMNPVPPITNSVFLLFAIIYVSLLILRTPINAS